MSESVDPTPVDHGGPGGRSWQVCPKLSCLMPKGCGCAQGGVGRLGTGRRGQLAVNRRRLCSARRGREMPETAWSSTSFLRVPSQMSPPLLLMPAIPLHTCARRRLHRCRARAPESKARVPFPPGSAGPRRTHALLSGAKGLRVLFRRRWSCARRPCQAPAPRCPTQVPWTLPSRVPTLAHRSLLGDPPRRGAGEGEWAASCGFG